MLILKNIIGFEELCMCTVNVLFKRVFLLDLRVFLIFHSHQTWNMYLYEIGIYNKITLFSTNKTYVDPIDV